MKKILFLITISICLVQVCFPVSEDYNTFLGLGGQLYFGSDFEVGLSLRLKTIYNLAVMLDVIWSRMYYNLAGDEFLGSYRWGDMSSWKTKMSSSDWIFYHQEIDYNVEVAYYFLHGFFQPYLALGPYLTSILPPEREVLLTYPDFRKVYNAFADKQNVEIGLTIKTGFDIHIPGFKYVSLGSDLLLRLDKIILLSDNIQEKGLGMLTENIFITINLFAWL